VLGDHARLFDIVVADRHDLDVTATLQGGKMVDLRYHTDPDDTETDGTLRHGFVLLDVKKDRTLGFAGV
jgi:hypothetical protein